MEVVQKALCGPSDFWNVFSNEVTSLFCLNPHCVHKSCRTIPMFEFTDQGAFVNKSGMTWYEQWVLESPCSDKADR